MKKFFVVFIALIAILAVANTASAACWSVDLGVVYFGSDDPECQYYGGYGSYGSYSGYGHPPYPYGYGYGDPVVAAGRMAYLENEASHRDRRCEKAARLGQFLRECATLHGGGYGYAGVQPLRARARGNVEPRQGYARVVPSAEPQLRAEPRVYEEERPTRARGNVEQPRKGYARVVSHDFATAGPLGVVSGAVTDECRTKRVRGYCLSSR